MSSNNGQQGKTDRYTNNKGEKTLRKKLSILFALVMAISLCLVPAVVQADDSVGISAGVYTNTLTLDNKTSAWATTPNDGIGGTLGYNAAGEEFVWGLEAAVLRPSTDYALIYYADKSNRFVDWGGDNPGALISLVTSDEFGVIAESGSTELGMDLPCFPDANQFELDYSGAPDNYDNAHGAKIWLVPATYLPTQWPNDGGWMTWSAEIVDNILFETDLITYDDADEISSVVSISVDPTNIDFGILTPGDTGTATITLTSGNTPINVTTFGTLTEPFASLTLNSLAYAAYTNGIDADDSESVPVLFTVPSSYTPVGEANATMTFIASPATTP